MTVPQLQRHVVTRQQVPARRVGYRGTITGKRHESDEEEFHLPSLENLTSLMLLMISEKKERLDGSSAS